MRRTPKPRTAAIAAAAGTLAAAAAAVIGLSGGGTSHASTPAPVSSIDSEARACLLTGPGASPALTAAAWTGMRQAAASSTHLLVQQFALPPNATPATFLDTLTQMRCTTIATVGSSLDTAVPPTANRTPSVRFLIIGGAPALAHNIIDLSPTQATPARVAQEVSKAG
ncbi:hypothetical protein [Streptacidiphilus albus]|uniref:hypothetical protein n=1 Tax=Streptacidiphilus albus TaxID=105425 RepID=UPI00054BAEAA|nr:hypothetical protein [Streptacidiphilus albus]